MNAHYPADWLTLELAKAKAQLGPWTSQERRRGYRVVKVIREDIDPVKLAEEEQR